jgi:hypothetical protein
VFDARVAFGTIGVARQILVVEHFDEELTRLVPAKQAGAAAGP